MAYVAWYMRAVNNIRNGFDIFNLGLRSGRDVCCSHWSEVAVRIRKVASCISSIEYISNKFWMLKKSTFFYEREDILQRFRSCKSQWLLNHNWKWVVIKCLCIHARVPILLACWHTPHNLQSHRCFSFIIWSSPSITLTDFFVGGMFLSSGMTFAEVKWIVV